MTAQRLGLEKAHPLALNANALIAQSQMPQRRAERIVEAVGIDPGELRRVEAVTGEQIGLEVGDDDGGLPVQRHDQQHQPFHQVMIGTGQIAKRRARHERDGIELMRRHQAAEFVQTGGDRVHWVGLPLAASIRAGV